MGYTQYFTTGTKATKEQWNKFCEQAKLIIAGFDGVIADGLGENEGAEINKHRIRLNGMGNDAHETFHIEFNSGIWDFCKTAQKPYDTVVVALLMLGRKLDIIASWSSDGNKENGDFDAAIELLKETIGEI